MLIQYTDTRLSFLKRFHRNKDSLLSSKNSYRNKLTLIIIKFLMKESVLNLKEKQHKIDFLAGACNTKFMTHR